CPPLPFSALSISAAVAEALNLTRIGTVPGPAARPPALCGGSAPTVCVRLLGASSAHANSATMTVSHCSRRWRRIRRFARAVFWALYKEGLDMGDLPRQYVRNKNESRL